jgi:hypothetical protein
VKTNVKTLPKDLIFVKEFVYDKCAFNCTEPKAEAESADYAAFTFQINDLYIFYREAKITPTKTGQFVTLWKRKKQQPIEPFHISDNIDFVLISTRKGNQFGQFIFPKSILIEKGIISTHKKEGKRAFRVYPPWDMTENRQAQKSQIWQLNYFLDLSEDRAVDFVKVKTLFGDTNTPQ